MISAVQLKCGSARALSFSAIARSVMISAVKGKANIRAVRCFSAIARSVMISAGSNAVNRGSGEVFQCYSS